MVEPGDYVEVIEHADGVLLRAVDARGRLMWQFTSPSREALAEELEALQRADDLETVALARLIAAMLRGRHGCPVYGSSPASLR